MPLSDRQAILQNYILASLGFEKNDFIEKYLNNLDGLVKNYRYLGAIEAVVIDPEIILKTDLQDSTTKFNGYNKYKQYIDILIMTEQIIPITPLNSYKQYKLEGKVFVPNTFSCLDYLMFEYNSKKKKNFKKAIKGTSLVSATDLANYTYCPVSYSIGKTFETDIVKSAVIGSNFHSENKLLNWTDQNFVKKGSHQQKKNTFSVENENNKDFFTDIKSSQVIYTGHSDNAQKYFINKKGNFVGQPDYVFQNINGENFIVEEKFKSKKEESIDSFFHSHKVQLASYLYGLDEFEASYGYLVYWYYNFDYSTQENQVTQCKVLKISRSKETQLFLQNAFVGLSSFIKEKKQDFTPEKLNPKNVQIVSSIVFVAIKQANLKIWKFHIMINTSN